MKPKNIKKFNYLIFFIFILFVFDAFTNTYIVLRENYDSRMIKNAGNCDRSGYGFNKKVYQKYKYIDKNIKVINFNNFPSSEGYFFDYKKKTNNKYLILIGSNKKKLEELLKSEFFLIYNEDNCYLLSK